MISVGIPDVTWLHERVASDVDVGAMGKGKCNGDFRPERGNVDGDEEAQELRQRHRIEERRQRAVRQCRQETE